MEGDSIILTLYRTPFVSALTFSQTWYLKRHLKGMRTALDIGAGSDSPVARAAVPWSAAVDAHAPALDLAKRGRTHSAYVLADVTAAAFRPRSVDAVVICECIEHLERADGERLIAAAEGWARKKVLISCPNGELAQDALYGNPYQVHRSAWAVGDLVSRGYAAYGMVGLKGKPSRRFFCIPLAAWAVASVVVQWWTRRHPEAAFEVFYVKDLERRPAA